MTQLATYGRESHDVLDADAAGPGAEAVALSLAGRALAPADTSVNTTSSSTPRKVVAYTATTLAWLGDNPVLAEEYARRAVAQYGDTTDGRWARRLATARVDLALVLAQIGQPAEAGHLGALDPGVGDRQHARRHVL
jgi:hypothetical protein